MIRVGLGMGLGGQGSMVAVAVAPPSSFVVNDTFTDVDETLLTAHVSDVSPAGSWVYSGTLNYGIRLNRTRVISGTGFGIVTRESGVSDFTLQCDVTWKTGEAAGVVFRTDGTTNNRWTFAFIESGDAVRLEKTIGGGTSSVSQLGLSLVTGTTYHTKIECTGGDIKCYVDGVLKASTTDTALSTFTKHGLTAYSPGTPTLEWDNFTVATVPSSTLYSDTFDRTDSATTLGSPWIVLQGTWGISGNEAYCVSDAHDDKIIIPAVGAANYAVSCDMKGAVVDDANARRPCIIVRYVNSTNYLQAHVITTSLAIQKNESGVVSTLASVGLTPSPPDNTYFTIKAECIGNTVQLYLDGVLKLSYTFTAGEQTLYGSAQQVGIRLRKSGSPSVAARWNNFNVTAL